MQFKINFRTSRNNVAPWYTTDDTNPGIGLDAIEEIREMIGNPKFPSKAIFMEDACKTKLVSYEINVADCKQVYKIPKFAAMSNITVIVKEGWLGQYYTLKLKKIYGEYEDDFLCFLFEWLCDRITLKPNRLKILKSVQGYYAFDHNKILNDWVEAGCPEYWGITKEEYDRKVKKYNENLDAFKKASKKKEEEEKVKKDQERKEKRKETLEYLAFDMAHLSKRLNDYIKEIK